MYETGYKERRNIRGFALCAQACKCTKEKIMWAHSVSAIYKLRKGLPETGPVSIYCELQPPENVLLPEAT